MNEFKEKSLLIHIFRYRLLARLLLLLICFAASLFGLLSPLFQKAFVDVLTNQDSMHYLGFKLSSNALINISLAFCASLICQLLSLFATYFAAREAFLIQQNIGDIIYRKMLSLRRDTLGHKSIGEVISIYATDVASATTVIEQTLPLGASILFPVILAPLFIHSLYDIPLLPTILTMSIFISFHLLLSVRQSQFFFKFKQLAAERSGLVNEWIQNIRSLRILAWLENFEKKIFTKRREETANRIQMVTNGQINSSVASSVSFFINLIAMFSMIYLSHKPVTPGEVLALLWIFGVFLTRPFRALPWVFTFAFDSYSSIKRVEHFLELGDSTENFQNISPFLPTSNSQVPNSPKLKISGLNLILQDQQILKDINLEVSAGEFLAIVGEVGSGKSLLLFSLMREVSANFNEFNIGDLDMLKVPLEQTKNYFTFVSQDGFVMSSNMRENIVFEYEASQQYDARVNTALKQAEFDMTRESLTDGLETEIGERGVNLSGGQKQRVGLARAIFYDRPIVLLDDSLSAVDIDTEKKLVQNLLLGRWQKHTRILVTHRLSVLQFVDRIAFLENGKISEIGTLAELMARSDRFRSFNSSTRVPSTDLKTDTFSLVLSEDPASNFDQGGK